MFSSIKTTKENKEIITTLTRRFDLKSENVIARMALAYSLENDSKLDLKDLGNARGKEYSRKVLLGENEAVLLGMVCTKYVISINDKDLGKYIKLHIDNGVLSLKELNDISSFFQLLN